MDSICLQVKLESYLSATISLLIFRYHFVIPADPQYSAAALAVALRL